jgi:iron(III) transport system permease protein
MRIGRGNSGSSLFLSVLDKALLFFVVGLILLFILYPIMTVMLQSVQIDGEWDFSYYRTLFTDNAGLLLNSLKVSVSVTFLSALFSVMVAITGAFASRKVGRFLQLVLLFTMISPPFVTSIAYISLFGKRGWLTYGLLGISWNPYGFTGIVAMQTLGFISLNALMLMGVIRGMDRTVLLSAQDVGATTNRIIKDMILPLIMPGIAVVLMLTFVRSLADFSTPAIIGGAYNVLATEAYLNVVAYGNITRAAAMNVLLFLPSLVAFVFYRRYFRQADITGTRALAEGELQLERKGVLYRLCGAVTAFFVLALILQYGSILVTAFTEMRFGTMYWTLDNLHDTMPYISGTFVRSIVYSLICGIFGSLLGFLLSYYLVIRKRNWLSAVDFIGTLPYIIPGTFFGLGYIFAFRSPPLQLVGTAAIVILNVVFRQLPFSTKVAQSSMVAIGSDIVQSGSDVGAHPLQVLKDIILPMSRSGFLVSFFNNFSQTMTTVGSIIFLVYPSQKLATLVMFDVLRSGKNRVGAMIAVLLMLIVVGVNLLFMLVTREKKHVSEN